MQIKTTARPHFAVARVARMKRTMTRGDEAVENLKPSDLAGGNEK